MDALNNQQAPFKGKLPRKRSRSIEDRRYYICFSHEQKVLYSLELFGVVNRDRVWTFLLDNGKDGRFSSHESRLLGFPYSLRCFVKAPDLQALLKTYCQFEPAHYREIFLLLAKRFG